MLPPGAWHTSRASARHIVSCSKGPAILKILRIVNLLCVANLLRVVIRYRDDPCVNAMFLGFYRGYFRYVMFLSCGVFY